MSNELPMDVCEIMFNVFTKMYQLLPICYSQFFVDLHIALANIFVSLCDTPGVSHSLLVCVQFPCIWQ